MKTHQELGITFAEYGALLGTRAMLVEQIIRFTPDKVVTPNIHAFNMGISCIAHNCGSVSCIGGTMGLIMGKDGPGADSYTYGQHGWHVPQPLGPLFFPNRDNSVGSEDVNYNVITPAQAVAAIDNFLNTGTPNWGAVLSLTRRRRRRRRMNGRERLAVLETALRANAANPTGMKFDLRMWLDNKQPTMDCGTVGCAVGLAILLPVLQAEGLGSYPNAWCGNPSPTFDGSKGWDAVMGFFDLDYDQSLHLFDYEEYMDDGPTQGAEAELRVAKRIREYLAATA